MYGQIVQSRSRNRPGRVGSGSKPRVNTDRLAPKTRAGSPLRPGPGGMRRPSGTMSATKPSAGKGFRPMPKSTIGIPSNEKRGDVIGAYKNRKQAKRAVKRGIRRMGR